MKPKKAARTSIFEQLISSFSSFLQKRLEGVILAAKGDFPKNFFNPVDERSGSSATDR
jgi:hypothetical protein